MGSHTFQEQIGGKGMTSETAYQALVQQAEHQYGCNPYNGTISTTSGFIVVDKGRRRARTVIEEILRDSSSDIVKWGPAGCIALSGAALTRWRKQHGLAGSRARAFVFFGHATS